jgi:hypothetical protein
MPAIKSSVRRRARTPPYNRRATNTSSSSAIGDTGFLGRSRSETMIVNQACVESETSDAIRRILQAADMIPDDDAPIQPRPPAIILDYSTQHPTYTHRRREMLSPIQAPVQAPIQDTPHVAVSAPIQDTPHVPVSAPIQAPPQESRQQRDARLEREFHEHNARVKAAAMAMPFSAEEEALAQKYAENMRNVQELEKRYYATRAGGMTDNDIMHNRPYVINELGCAETLERESKAKICRIPYRAQMILNRAEEILNEIKTD